MAHRSFPIRIGQSLAGTPCYFVFPDQLKYVPLGVNMGKLTLTGSPEFGTFRFGPKEKNQNLTKSKRVFQLYQMFNKKSVKILLKKENTSCNLTKIPV